MLVMELRLSCTNPSIWMFQFFLNEVCLVVVSAVESDKPEAPDKLTDDIAGKFSSPVEEVLKSKWNLSYGNITWSEIHNSSLWSGDAIWYQRSQPSLALVHVIACHLSSPKPLPEPMLTYCQLNPQKHISVKFYLKCKHFHSRRCICKLSSAKCRPFCVLISVW